jgi:hypothetical protein
MSNQHPSTKEVEHGHDRLEGSTEPESPKLERAIKAPVYADESQQVLQYSGPPEVSVQAMSYDANFTTAFNATLGEFPSSSIAGDAAFLQAAANTAYRYINAAGSFALTSISPTTAVHNAPLTLTATGTAFDANAHIYFAGVDVPRTTCTPTQIVANVPATLIPTATTYAVTVHSGKGVVTASQTFTAT